MNLCAFVRKHASQRGFHSVAIFLLLWPSAHAQTSVPASWDLAWSDEFNGPAGTLPDSRNWTYDTGGGGWGNKELEVYCAPASDTPPCDPKEPHAFHDGHGHLLIRAVESHGIWSSARLKSAGKREFQYGRIEARMQLPPAAGFWPAFWMLGANISTMGWPGAGEQDIMEWVQSYGAGTTSSTVHGPGYSGAHGISHSFSFRDDGRVDDRAFHTYGVIWSRDSLQFYRDDYTRPFVTLTPASIPKDAPWVYNHPFFLLLNFAIGSGGFPGATDASTPTTGTMLVDYVRVYQVHDPEHTAKR